LPTTTTTIIHGRVIIYNHQSY